MLRLRRLSLWSILLLCAQGAAADADGVKPLAPAALQRALVAPEVEAGNRIYATDPVGAAMQFRRAADAGNAMAQTYLGYMAHQGIGVPQDDAAAADWYRRAAQQGYALAEYALGKSYDQGRGVLPNRDAALHWYRLAAAQGQRAAQAALGAAYLKGNGVPQDRVQGVTWLTRAADQGDQDAIRLMTGEYFGERLSEADFVPMQTRWFSVTAQEPARLARIYETGEGTPRDAIAAAYWRAWMTGKSAAAPRSLDAAVPPLSGDAVMQAWLAKDVRVGETAMGPYGDLAAAAEAFARAAEDGNPVAQNFLAYFYMNGIGVERNDLLAADWARKAATQGYAPAETRLGEMLSEGRGVAASPAEALDWLRLAVDQGNGYAMVALGNLYLRGFEAQGQQMGQQVPADPAEALALYQRSAAARNPAGQYALYRAYAAGSGVTADAVEAARWCKLAAEQRYLPAMQEMAHLSEAGLGMPQDAVQATYWRNLSAARQSGYDDGVTLDPPKQ